MMFNLFRSQLQTENFLCYSVQLSIPCYRLIHGHNVTERIFSFIPSQFKIFDDPLLSKFNDRLQRFKEACTRGKIYPILAEVARIATCVILSQL